MATRNLHIAILLVLVAVPLWAYQVGADPNAGNSGHGSPDSAFQNAGRINDVMRAINTSGKKPCDFGIDAISSITREWTNPNKTFDTVALKDAEIKKVLDKLEKDSNYVILAIPPRSDEASFADFLGNASPIGGPQDACLKLKKEIRTHGEPERDLVKEAIINRRYGALRDLQENKNIADAADTIVQWAYLTGRPSMKPVGRDGKPPTPDQVLEQIEEIYSKEISEGTDKEPLKSLRTEPAPSLKEFFRMKQDRLQNGKLKLSDAQKKELKDAIVRLQGDVDSLKKQFANAPNGTVGQGPQVAGGKDSRDPNAAGGQNGKQANRSPRGSRGNGGGTGGGPSYNPSNAQLGKAGDPIKMEIGKFEVPKAPDEATFDAKAFGARESAPVRFDTDRLVVAPSANMQLAVPQPPAPNYASRPTGRSPAERLGELARGNAAPGRGRLFNNLGLGSATNLGARRNLGTTRRK